MCQATVILDGEEYMRDVLRIEPLPDGVRLTALSSRLVLCRPSSARLT